MKYPSCEGGRQRRETLGDGARSERPRPRPRRRAGLSSRLCAIAALIIAVACRPAPETPTLFERLPSRATGITFENQLPEDSTFNILNFLYYYNGGGVAAGDVNNDGLPDLYFTSNRGSNRLYLNRGGYWFDDVTERAGVAGAGGWTTGVAMADVTGDGFLDLYVSGINHREMQGRNVLYVNDGDGTFTDRTKELGLDFEGYGTQAAFFDYDGDGDLDAYLLTYSTHSERQVGRQADRRVRHPRAGDRLYRNDDGHFVDASEQAGILGGVEGYGLGVVASDVNLDGCPDIYVANDFQENDFLYVNNCDGTFTESLATATGHTSRFSMGVDAADMNNDGRPDLVVADMLPRREEILKTSASVESYALTALRSAAGYQPQYSRNTLQLNRGRGRFSEIAFLAGVAATDWSWAPLFADLDDDGHKDLFVTSGIPRRPNDLDYLTFVGGEGAQRSLATGGREQTLALLEKMPRVPIANHAFRNNADLTFMDMAERWGLAHPGFSNGAVYVDLNNSGALDLVVNNINAPASIYRNRGRALTGNHSLTVVLRGAGRNTAGIGAKVFVHHGAVRQLLEQMPTRGFQSSVDARLHFGLGRATRADSLTVIWPDGRTQTMRDVAGDQTLTLLQSAATGRHSYPTTVVEPALTDVTTLLGVDVTHVENAFVEFDREPMMPQLLSAEGPALAVGDVNGDGLDDLFVGGARWQRARLLVQQRDGHFRASEQPSIDADSAHEDVDAAFLDANGDGHADLVVVSGGNELWTRDEALRSRLYLGDGGGKLVRSVDALPPIFENGSCVAAADFDGDGDVDLFLGSRAVARQYGVSPSSHLLRNDGTGRFSDVTAALAPSLAKAGMVTSAAWSDYDGDGALDLIVAGDWMPVRVFRQAQARFVETTATAGLGAASGWWNSIMEVRTRAAGPPDLLLGNLGLNSFVRASPSEPARLHVNDFARTGAGPQAVPSFFRDGVSHPMATRDELLRAIPSLRSKYPSYRDFGASRVENIFPTSELRSSTVLEARRFASSLARNRGDGTFELSTLPMEAQFAPIRAAVSGDFDGDGLVDLLVAGNFHEVSPIRGRYDASYGLLLRGTARGAFVPVDMADGGVMIEGQVRRMRTLRGADGSQLVAVARNNDRLALYRSRSGGARAAAASAVRGSVAR